MTGDSGAPPRPRERGRGHHNGVIVVVVLLALATGIGTIAYWRFVVSDRYLRQDIAQMRDRGTRLTAEQCVDAVIRWSDRCKAMKSLCDSETPRLMDVCLEGRDRTEYCRDLGEKPRDTGFGYHECEARDLDRHRSKTCGKAYRSIANHCAYILSDAEARELSPVQQERPRKEPAS